MDNKNTAGTAEGQTLLPGEENTNTLPFYAAAMPEEWIAAFVEWTQSHINMPLVPAFAFSREADYE